MKNGGRRSVYNRTDNRFFDCVSGVGFIELQSPHPAVVGAGPAIAGLSVFDCLGGLWITPFGPTVNGAAILPFVFFGVFVFFFFHLFGQPQEKKTKQLVLEIESEEPDQAKNMAEVGFLTAGFVLWTLISILIGAVIARYLFN